ncbi:hypothetical protein JZ751_005122 [Albula glossodonta]|uniref:Uncharacterized protein n=1 Tax=Albula glossodonta TaxID=121402 RepID=A0A8T2P4V4_9TELE|nr:hypothetical protein JZ751_005122 [Albula glossodonta]
MRGRMFDTQLLTGNRHFTMPEPERFSLNLAGSLRYPGLRMGRLEGSHFESPPTDLCFDGLTEWNTKPVMQLVLKTFKAIQRSFGWDSPAAKMLTLEANRHCVGGI